MPKSKLRDLANSAVAKTGGARIKFESTQAGRDIQPPVIVIEDATSRKDRLTTFPAAFCPGVVALTLGIGSVLSFTLTFLDKIDHAFGIPSGTVTLGLASWIYGRHFLQFIKAVPPFQEVETEGSVKERWPEANWGQHPSHDNLR